MARLTEEMVIARSKQSDLSAIKKLNCWGAELGDVSLVRRMPNVEVLALSINKIRTLGDFAGCRRLRELYIRKNDIRDLREIRHLRALPDLTSLWLDENPCTHHPQYRLTVLRNLPNLEKLDNVPVHPDEMSEALARGALVPDSDDEGGAPPECCGAYRSPSGSAGSAGSAAGGARSADSSPERAPEPYQPADGAEDAGAGGGAGPAAPDTSHQGGARRAGGAGGAETDERYEHPAMTRSHHDARGGGGGAEGRERDPPLRHSYSAHSVKEFSYAANGGGGGGGAGGGGSPPHHHYHEPYYERAPDRCESYQQVPRGGAADAWERDGGGARDYPSAVMAERRGFTRRPVARNSNLLSAVLCLVKELDYPSLEVAEMAVRCRMDELANAM